MLFRCVCIARHLCVWIVDHVAHAIALYLERMCRVCLLELSDKQVDSNTYYTTYKNIKCEVHKPRVNTRL